VAKPFNRIALPIWRAQIPTRSGKEDRTVRNGQSESDELLVITTGDFTDDADTAKSRLIAEQFDAGRPRR
jgi:hypothetical protein